MSAKDQRYISTNFTADENRCNCGECVHFSADIELVRVLENLRANFGGQPVRVHSWFRCRAHNNRPKGEANAEGVLGAGSGDHSWHLFGAAVDISINEVKPLAIQQYLRRTYHDRYGFGLYLWGVHIDVRPYRSDWHDRGL